MTRRLLLAITLVMMCALATPLSAKAFDPFGRGQNCQGNSDSSAVCDTKATNKDPIAGPDGILIKITRIAAYIGGAVAIIMIIVGGIQFITSGTDLSTSSRTDTEVERAKSTIASALIGLVVIVLAQYIITYVILKLGGS